VYNPHLNRVVNLRVYQLASLRFVRQQSQLFPHLEYLPVPLVGRHLGNHLDSHLPNQVVNRHDNRHLNHLTSQVGNLPHSLRNVLPVFPAGIPHAILLDVHLAIRALSQVETHL
jgi:hypothetical protein